MPRIFDNIDRELLPTLRVTIEIADRADFCVGYVNLRGWRLLAPLIQRWEGGDGHCCRLLVGMHRLPEEELRVGFGTGSADEEIDNQTALRINRKPAEAFRTQLTFGAPRLGVWVDPKQPAPDTKVKAHVSFPAVTDIARIAELEAAFAATERKS